MQIDILKNKLDFNDNQAAVYMALLQMGSGNINEVAKIAKVKRTTVYSVLDNLIQRGLVNMIEKGAHREYFAENPKKIPTIYETEIAQIKERERTISEILPELGALFNAHSTKPHIRTYEGMEGIKSVFYETLLLPKGAETLAFASYQRVHKYLWDWMPIFIKKRADKGITQRLITENSEDVAGLMANDKRDLRETRLVSRDQFPLDCDQINIFGNKVFIASYKDLMAVVIESAVVAKTMKSIFELAWLGASIANKDK